MFCKMRLLLRFMIFVRLTPWGEPLLLKTTKD